MIDGGLDVFDIKFIHMDETPFYKRPWFYVTGWLAFLLLFYGAQVYRMGGFQANQNTVLFDLFCILPLFFLLWMVFFAQFVLPVKTFPDRQKIFYRLVSHLFRSHGPAVFVENGVIKEHSGERLKKGPGVVWLDSASAAVTRTPVAIKQIMGPGVHFISTGEFIAGTLDLHTQFQSLGPKETDRPFAPKKEGQTEEEWNLIQDRRKMVSALTRDGIEVVPDISIRFRVDTGSPTDNEPGSRFGYRTGRTKQARENEKKDKESIRKAILGEAINPMEAESSRRRIAWNELPAALAVDVWREYVGKFTLDELFKASQEVPLPLPRLLQLTSEEVDPLSQPVRVDPSQRNHQGGLAGMLHEINKSMARAIESLEKDTAAEPKPPFTIPSPASQIDETRIPSSKTALQIINEMVMARLTQPKVDILSDTGQRGVNQDDSEEYRLLGERGLKVLNVSISNIRMNPALEEQLIKQWSTTWLKTAREENEQLDRKRSILEASAQEKLQIEYVERLSREINEYSKRGRPDPKGLLKVLLLRSRAMIRSGEHSDQLRRRMTLELQEIEDMIKWLEEDVK